MIVALTLQMETLKGDLKLSKNLIAMLKKSDPKKEWMGRRRRRRRPTKVTRKGMKMEKNWREAH